MFRSKISICLFAAASLIATSVPTMACDMTEMLRTWHVYVAKLSGPDSQPRTAGSAFLCFLKFTATADPTVATISGTNCNPRKPSTPVTGDVTLLNGDPAKDACLFKATFTIDGVTYRVQRLSANSGGQATGFGTYSGGTFTINMLVQ